MSTKMSDGGGFPKQKKNKAKKRKTSELAWKFSRLEIMESTA